METKKNLLKAIQTSLASTFPKLKKLEDSMDLINLTLTGLTIEKKSSGVTVFYTAVASPEVYPHIRSRLIEKGVIKKHEVYNLGLKLPGTSQNYEEMRLIWGHEGINVHAWLKVFEPRYEEKGTN